MAIDARNKGYGIPDSLLRQRRNGFAVSVVLVTLALSKARIDSIGAVGLHLTFDRPEAIFWLLWASWLYFLIRYYQYYNLQVAPFAHAAFIEHLKAFGAIKVEKLFQRYLVEARGARTKGERQDFIDSDLGQAYSKAKFENVDRLEFKWHTDDRETGKTLERGKVISQMREFSPEIRRAWRAAYLKLPYVTDYFFPYLVFIGSAVLAIAVPWAGNPLVMIGVLSCEC